VFLRNRQLERGNPLLSFADHLLQERDFGLSEPEAVLDTAKMRPRVAELNV
jgi:hypothetical protein